MNPQMNLQKLHTPYSTPFPHLMDEFLMEAKIIEKIYDVPMKFARKLIHGGQCTIAMNQWRSYKKTKNKKPTNQDKIKRPCFALA